MTMTFRAAASACRSAYKRGGEKLFQRKSNIAGLSSVSFLLALSCLQDNAKSPLPSALQESGHASSSSSSSTLGTTTIIEPQMEEIISEYSKTVRSYYYDVVQKLLLLRGPENSITNEDKEAETNNLQSFHEDHLKPAARFPSLQARLLLLLNEDDTNTPQTTFPINSNEPIPVDNDLFVGQVMLVLRPLNPQDDPDYEKRVREQQEDTTTPTFQFQIQGRFKKSIRKDQIFVGAEITERMRLGSLTRRVSDLLLRLLSNNMGAAANMTYSFGTDTELPHIAFPLHTGMWNVVISKPCEQAAPPPPIGTPFIESEESRTQRFKQDDRHSKDDESSSRSSSDEDEYWNTEDTYSMSYSAASIDLPAWKILLPFEIHLARFWGESALRLVIYEEEKDKEHQHQKKKKYLFNLQIEHLGGIMPTSSLSAVNNEKHMTQPPPLLSSS